ncbi:unnamed protein product [Toxocara canis]|uniref:Peptidase A2 domain-containing protein n=1 Tax=Toxocara canis TaxID=6265 RepID=A0A183U988_TOXCA|nr:unnamed protein product [Toxocara canis]
MWRIVLGERVQLCQQEVPQLQIRRSQKRPLQASKRKRNLKPRTTNNVVIIASTGTDVAPANHIYRKVQTNGATIQMSLDTGADVTLLSVSDWIKSSRPELLSQLLKLKSANKKDVRVRGYFQRYFDIEGHKGRGNCHVADAQSLFGLDWIA